MGRTEGAYMWILIFGTAFVAAILGFAYLCNRVYKMIPDRGAVCAYGKDIRLRLFVVLGFAVLFLARIHKRHNYNSALGGILAFIGFIVFCAKENT